METAVNSNKADKKRNEHVETRTFLVLRKQLKVWLSDSYERYSKSIFSNIAVASEIKHDEQISLFSPKMIVFLDELFSQTEIYLEFQKIIRNSNKHDEKIWEKLTVRLGDICLFAERAYLFLLSVMEDASIDISLVKRRIISIRKQRMFSYAFASKAKAEEVMMNQLISIDVAFSLYHRTKIQRKEMILAGGDATRFLKIVKVLAALEFSFLDEKDIFMIKYNHGYKDIAHLFSLEALKRVFMTPMFQYIGCTQSEVESSFTNEGIDLQRLKPYLDRVIDTFKPGIIPKAMNVVYKCVGENKVVYLSFFAASIIRIYAEILREDSFGSELIYVVKDKNQLDAFSNSLHYIYTQSGLDEKRLKITFIETTKAAIPLSDYHKGFVFDGEDIVVSSPGHGPAFIKVMNDHVKAQSSGACVSLRTLDNSGAHVMNYATLVQKAVVFENGVRDELVDALNGSKKKIVGFFRQLGIFSDIDLKEKIAEYVKKRWDFSLDSKSTYKDMALTLVNMPISVILVISGYESEGGGLYVLDTEEMVVVDNYKSEEQRGSKKFNPMIFATYVKEAFPEEFDRECLFVTTKGDGNKTYYQAESASTHIATCPHRTLKRFLDFNREDRSEIFIQQKTIEDSTEDKNKAFTDQLIKDIELICSELNLEEQEFIVSVHTLQKQFLNKF